MKNVLFASTALVAFGFAGAAFAQAQSSTSITLSGMGEIGITSIDDNGANDGELQLHNDVDLRWALVGVTDGGISFGANIDWDEAPNEEDASVFISGSFGTITVGDTDSAYERAMIEIAAGGIVDEAAFYESEYDNFDGISDNESQVGRYDIAFGGTVLSLGYEDGQDDGNEDVYGIGASFTFGTVGLGLGYENSDGLLIADSSFNGIVPVGGGGVIDDFDIYGISASVDLGGVNLIAGYEAASADAGGNDFDYDTAQISATFALGAGTLGLNYSTTNVEVDTAGDGDTDAYGIWYDYNLGGGATFTAAAGQLEGTDLVGADIDETRFGAGISMAF